MTCHIHVPASISALLARGTVINVKLVPSYLRSYICHAVNCPAMRASPSLSLILFTQRELTLIVDAPVFVFAIFTVIPIPVAYAVGTGARVMT